MRPFVHGSQSLTSHVSVDLRRPHIGVSEQLLNSPEIGSALEEVGRVGVPEGVGVEGPAVGQRMAGEDPPGVAGGEPPAAGVEEQRVGRGCSGHELGPARPEVVRGPRPGGLAERHAGAPSRPCRAR